MDFKDLLLTPLYLAFIYLLFYIYRRRVTNRFTRKYFFLALHFKIIGAIGIGMLYWFYYGKGNFAGDTFAFYSESTIIYNTFFTSPLEALELIFKNPENYSAQAMSHVVGRTQWLYSRDHSSAFIVKLSGLLGVFTFHTYTLIAIIFAAISFSGIWALYRVVFQIYPHLHKKIALAILFMPSVFFWGSGLLKDSITLGAIGWACYGFYFGILQKKSMLGNIIVLLFSLWVIKTIKIYLLLSLIPAFTFWIFLTFHKKLKSNLVRALIIPLLLLIAIPITYLFIDQLTQNTRFSLDEIATTTKTNTEWNEISGSSDASYSLGEFDGSLGSLVEKFPKAIVVSLFQPFIWQVRNPVMLFAALQTTFILFLTLKTLLKVRFRFFQIILEHPFVACCWIFTILLAFGTGLNSGNYGTLDRYRIPFIPFYVCALYIMQYYAVNKRKKASSLAITE